ncbi:MAG: hypothetical protein ACK4OP_03880 [Gemmobacter sp.]
MTIARDDLRAAVAAGLIDERQAAGLMALADARRGARASLDAREEPFELFRGFNEIFIVVGLVILFAGWSALTGLLEFAMLGMRGVPAILTAAATMAGLAVLARYFTLRRRMVAPSIALTVMFALSAAQAGVSLGWVAGLAFGPRFVLAAALATVAIGAWYAVFRVPFAMALVALGVFATAVAVQVSGGALPEDPADFFLLTKQGPFAWVTIVIGIAALGGALWFDMSDPHRVGLRAATGFWLHVIAAPVIVNTVALSLLEIGTLGAQMALMLFLAAVALFAVVIDRRSFLVSGVGYVVALAVIFLQDGAALAILGLGLALVLLGAQWERLRTGLMRALPAFPGKTRLPPWETPA